MKSNISGKVLRMIASLLTVILVFSAPAATAAYSQTSQFVSGYDAVIDDRVPLLAPEDMEQVAGSMIIPSYYCNVGFAAYGGKDTAAAITKAAQWGEYTFGSGALFTVFMIDMTTRELAIYSSAGVDSKLTEAEANRILEGVYQYATEGKYAQCAAETFQQIGLVLSGEGSGLPDPASDAAAAPEAETSGQPDSGRYETREVVRERRILDHYETYYTYEDDGHGAFVEVPHTQPVYRTETYTETVRVPVPAEEDITGEWYLTRAVAQGVKMTVVSDEIQMTFTFREDGTVQVLSCFPGEEKNQEEGTWTYADGEITLTMSGENAYSEKMRYENGEIFVESGGAEMILTREPYQPYELPATVKAESMEAFYGSWYLAVNFQNGMMILLDDALPVEQRAMLTVSAEGIQETAVNGSITPFDNPAVDPETGVLGAALNVQGIEAAVQMALLEDGSMLITTSAYGVEIARQIYHRMAE